ncbi:PQ loop repeat-domain-containing protein [Phellopilus nigrolimitatus]|nr:PQ loop repeat-domain-containing protein [Phellopilus nigrolimitatus]
MGSGTVSDLLGWASIGCWLGAQFPQVLENVRRQSCDGLALPFLFNWLLGDITNLIGCLLTHQLPFQTILATYFVSVDFMLFSQYFYYGSLTPTPSPGLLESSPSQRYSSYGRRFSSEHDHHYRELSNAAANVAIAAALAASEEELHGNAKTPVDGSQRPAHRRRSTSITRSEAEEAEDEVDEDALAALADSFHSEGGRKRVSWSQERHGGRGGSASQTRTGASARASLSPIITMRSSLIPSSSDADFGDGVDGGQVEGAAAARGRPRQRQVVDSPLDDEDLEGQGGLRSRTVSKGGTADRRSSRASHRNVGLVFLGAWALFGIGTLSGPKQGLDIASPLNARGVVLSKEIVAQTIHLDLNSGSDGIHSEGSLEAVHFSTVTESLSHQTAESEPPPESSSERVIGRIFAWMCTTLYLTSRLPQIWKNFVRKSVEGLSMYLFIFAFLGNTFYVLSILTSPMMFQPQPASTAFILESIPYLLGSGGTLLFDVTIVAQSLIYRPRPGHDRRRPPYSRSRAGSHAHLPKQGSTHVHAPSAHGRSLSGARVPAYTRSRSASVLQEEEQALLGSDVRR